MSGQAEQELGMRFGEKDKGEIEVERELFGKIASQKLSSTQDLDRYVHPVREVNDGEKNVGKEDDTCIQAEQEWVDNKVAGVEFHQQEDGSVGGVVGSMKTGQAQCVGSQVVSVAVGRNDIVDVDRCVNEQEAGVGGEVGDRKGDEKLSDMMAQKQNAGNVDVDQNVEEKDLEDDFESVDKYV